MLVRDVIGVISRFSSCDFFFFFAILTTVFLVAVVGAVVVVVASPYSQYAPLVLALELSLLALRFRFGPCSGTQTNSAVNNNMYVSESGR